MLLEYSRVDLPGGVQIRNKIMESHHSKSKAKRNLYQPVTDASVGMRKTRRPLIQGKLVTDADSGICHSSGNNLSTGSLEFSVQRTPQTNPNLDDSEPDPTLSPMRRVPQLTEKSSPRPEPPSSCLDLSDVDLDLRDTPSSRGQGRPVMVYDASGHEETGSSGHSCEVATTVGFEASPARVICHTPSRLDKARNSPLPALSPLAVTVNLTPRHNSSLRGAGGPAKSDRSVRTLFTEDDEVSNKDSEDEDIQFNFKRKGGSGDTAMQMSQQGRGIIEEILAHEMGNSNIEVISLSSQQCSPATVKPSTKSFPSPTVPNLIDASQSDKAVEAEREAKSSPISSSQPKQSVLNEPDDSDSASIASEVWSLYEYVKPKISPTQQKKEVAAPSDPSTTEQPPKQMPTRNKPKKKAPRPVASRYMQRTTSRLNNTSNADSSNSNSISVVTSSTSATATTSAKTQRAAGNRSSSMGKQARERQPTVPQKAETRPFSATSAVNKTKAGRTGTLRTGTTLKPPVSRKVHNGSSSNNNKNVSATPQHLAVRGEAVGGGRGDSRQTSTPTSDHHPASLTTSYIDASAIQSTSNMLINVSAAQFDMTLKDGESSGNMTEESRGKRPKQGSATSRGAGDGGESKTPSQLELDMAYTRYLQWHFLLGRARRAFENQQHQASAQLHGVWKLNQARRRENAQTEADVARLRSISLLDKVLDEAEPELSPLMDDLPALAADYGQMAAALDGTRHQLPIKDIHLPAGGDVGREAMEERLSASLTKAERLLADINSTVKGNDESSPLRLSQYRDCLSAIEKSSGTTAKELNQCWRDLDEIRMLNTRLSSLRIQDMQHSVPHSQS